MKPLMLCLIIVACVIVRFGERCIEHSPDGVCCVKKVKI